MAWPEDLALLVGRHSTFYRATTCLALDMAYNEAHQLTKPDPELVAAVD